MSYTAWGIESPLSESPGPGVGVAVPVEEGGPGAGVTVDALIPLLLSLLLRLVLEEAEVGVWMSVRAAVEEWPLIMPCSARKFLMRSRNSGTEFPSCCIRGEGVSVLFGQ